MYREIKLTIDFDDLDSKDHISEAKKNRQGYSSDESYRIHMNYQMEKLRHNRELQKELQAKIREHNEIHDTIEDVLHEIVIETAKEVGVTATRL